MGFARVCAIAKNLIVNVDHPNSSKVFHNISDLEIRMVKRLINHALEELGYVGNVYIDALTDTNTGYLAWQLNNFNSSHNTKKFNPTNVIRLIDKVMSKYFESVEEPPKYFTNYYEFYEVHRFSATFHKTKDPYNLLQEKYEEFTSLSAGLDTQTDVWARYSYSPSDKLFNYTRTELAKKIYYYTREFLSHYNDYLSPQEKGQILTLYSQLWRKTRCTLDLTNTEFLFLYTDLATTEHCVTAGFTLKGANFENVDTSGMYFLAVDLSNTNLCQLVEKNAVFKDCCLFEKVSRVGSAKDDSFLFFSGATTSANHANQTDKANFAFNTTKTDPQSYFELF